MLDDLRLHRHLLGKTGSRAELNTPALAIDREALARNIERMASFARSTGVSLRPHSKTHKSVHIARLQIAAGAVGICCAKLGEAEALADGGIESILITSPVVTAAGIARLIALNARMRDLAVVVDNPANVAALAAAAAREETLKVLIDIDPGVRRTGAPSISAALELLESIRSSPKLEYRGIQMYCGTQQHIASYAERADAIADRTQYLRTVIGALSERGAAPTIVTGCGTGTHYIDASLRVFNEWQVGSYIFMDRQYAECDLANQPTVPYEYSLFVEATVVSANTRGMATIDSGIKALSTDGGLPVIVSGAPAGATYRFMGDEHGAIVDPAGRHTWSIGDRVRLAVPHCDPTVNLYDAYHVTTGETLVDIWPVSARGRSR
ncbi:D-serine deaminase-like pyridoxal phosphate-dependent protein [Povalibacter uvarum]|uniref:D-serine deaminase-like pyridoxal phosphate-dependent protein n=1 Tax=Povalibacter uvarum TaxID=732238 RepID=A0A841HKH8_9GAMM|nr:DSD1 family PLP-dependent enzyme [Povalibacter uvarum]MBB6093711.1 D-serine deaminase-like pyridoxal phosphate-dependent protein [Povalibacter uvarum]